MNREIDLEKVGMVLDNTAKAEYEVAIKRNEDLWYTKRGLDEKILFLHCIGVVSEREKKKMLEWSEDQFELYTRKKKAKYNPTWFDSILDTDF